VALFGVKGKGGDWLAVGVYADRLDIALVERRSSGRPVVQLCASYAKKGGDVETLKAVARSVRAERFRCLTMLEASDYRMQLVEAPAVPRTELKAAVRWKLKDLLDYPVDAATVDIAEVPADRSGALRGQYVFAVCARNERIGARMQLFRDAKLPLQVIDVPEMAQRNIAQLFEEAGRGLALLAFDDHGGMLTITAGGELYLARRTDMTAEQLFGVPGEQSAERLVLELQRTLDHFDRQHSQLTVSRLLVAPRPGEIGLEQQLAENLDLPVRVLDLSEVLDIGGVPEMRDVASQGHWLHIVGAALRDERAAA